MANGDAFYGWPRIVFYDTNKNYIFKKKNIKYTFAIM